MKGSDFYAGWHRMLANLTILANTLGLVVSIFIIIFVLVFGVYFAVQTPRYDFQNWLAYELAGGVQEGYIPLRSETFAYHTAEGEKRRFPISERDSIRPLTASAEKVKNTAFWGAVLGVPIAGFLGYMIAIRVASWKRGRGEKGFVRGAKYAESEELARMIKQAKDASELMLGNVPLPESLMKRHIVFSGDSGTGKSQALFSVINWAKNVRGDKGVILDKTGEATQNFYDPERDIILSPFDDRSMGWTPFNEGHGLLDFERMAKSFIPMKSDGASGNEHWPEASLTTLTWLLHGLCERGDRTIDDIIETVTHSYERVETDALGEERVVKIRGLNDLLKGTLADMVIDPSSPEHASSVIGTLVPKIRSLWFLRGLEDRPQFSFRKWVSDDAQKGWVFIRVSEDQMDSVSPLVTAWIDTLIKSLLSLDESSTRAVWAAVDEAQSLEKINSLYKGLAEGRKHGLRLLLGFASMNQMQDIYGERSAKGIMGGFGTKLVYRTTEPDAAEWNSKMLLHEDVILEQQSMSFGTNDNLSASENRKEQALVTPSQIAGLPDLSAYVRFSGGWPTSRIEFKYKAWPKLSSSFMPRVQPPHYFKFNQPEPEGDEGQSEGQESPAGEAQQPKKKPKKPRKKAQEKEVDQNGETSGNVVKIGQRKSPLVGDSDPLI